MNSVCISPQSTKQRPKKGQGKIAGVERIEMLTRPILLPGQRGTKNTSKAAVAAVST